MNAVVIGAGFAGLLAAIRLRQAGAHVTVLERLPRAGGKAALGAEQGGWSEFSSGPTVVTMPQVFRGVHARVGLPAPVLSPARPTTRYQYPDGRVFAPEALALAGDLDSTLSQLSRQEGHDYTRLLNAARRMYDDASGTFIFGPPPTPSQLARYALTHGRHASPHLNLSQLVQSGPYLTPFWLRFATYLGADPYRAPAVLHNISWVELGAGIWHLEGGLGAFAARLASRAEQLGVVFEYGTRVEHLLMERGRVAAAHTRQGRVQRRRLGQCGRPLADFELAGAWSGAHPTRRERLRAAT